MRILIVSGIWPPDVGGPASHAPEVADWLRQRGHDVEAVVTSERAPDPRPYPVHWVSRALPPGLRHGKAVQVIQARSRRADAVYSTGMFGRSSLGAFLARTPIVLKMTADPAFERARRRGLVQGDVEAFQHGGGGIVSAILRTARDAAIGHAAHVVCPSTFMRDLALSWGLPSSRVDVLPNPAPSPDDARPFDVGPPPVIAFAGRLTAQKGLDTALAALRALPEVRLLIAGDGPERSRLTEAAGPNVQFLGPLPRQQVLGLLRAAQAAILTSEWENFPHGVVEALAVGTPVIATRVGGVAEIVRDGENGLLVEAGDSDAFGAAVTRMLSEPGLREKLAANAARSVDRFSRDVVYRKLESILEAAVA